MDLWKPKGYICRSFNWENSNVTFDEAAHFDDLEQSETAVLSSPLELFLDLSDYSPRHLYEGREIRASCSEHIRDLQHGGEGAPGSLAVCKQHPVFFITPFSLNHVRSTPAFPYFRRPSPRVFQNMPQEHLFWESPDSG